MKWQSVRYVYGKVDVYKRQVVHNGIAVAGHRVFSAKQPDGTLHGFIIEEQIVVHQVTLDGIATLYPTVALDAVHKEFTGSKVHGCLLYTSRCV